MFSFFYITIYQPLFNALIFIYQSVGLQDLGISIIVLTILVRVILFPLFHKSEHYQAAMQKLQPKIKEIQKLHKGDTQKQSEALMHLYREHNINPFSGFLLLLIQLPVFITLYQVFAGDFAGTSLDGLYAFVSRPTEVHQTLLNLINLQESSIILVILAAIFQYLQGYLATAKVSGEGELSSAEQIGKQMIFIGPIITVVVLLNLPAAIALYWTVNGIFSVIQQYIVNKKLNNTNLLPIAE